MNRANFEHTGYALLMMAIVWALTNNALAGAFAGAFFFIGREHAQAEYRMIQKFYEGKRANMPWWGGFDPRAWDTKSMLDWLLPTVLGFMIAWIAS